MKYWMKENEAELEKQKARVEAAEAERDRLKQFIGEVQTFAFDGMHDATSLDDVKRSLSSIVRNCGLRS